MRFVDYKCSDCGNICEIVLMGNGIENIKCESCGSSNMARVFALSVLNHLPAAAIIP